MLLKGLRALKEGRRGISLLTFARGLGSNPLLRGGASKHLEQIEGSFRCRVLDLAAAEYLSALSGHVLQNRDAVVLELAKAVPSYLSHYGEMRRMEPLQFRQISAAQSPHVRLTNFVVSHERHGASLHGATVGKCACPKSAGKLSAERTTVRAARWKRLPRGGGGVTPVLPRGGAALLQRGRAEGVFARWHSTRRTSTMRSMSTQRSHPRPSTEVTEESSVTGEKKHQALCDPRTMTSAWAGYLREVRGLAATTATKYERIVSAYIERSTGWPTRGSLEVHLRELFARGLGESARKIAVAALRSWCEYLRAHGVIDLNPAADLRAPRIYQREASTLTVGEVKRLLDLPIEPSPMALRNRAIVHVLYIGGLRAGEVGGLRVDRLVWDEVSETFSLRLERAKWARDDQSVSLDASASRMLGAYLRVRPRPETPWLFPSDQGRPLSRWQVARVFGQAVREAGIEAKGRRLSPHTLRHSIASHMLERGWSIRTVQEHLRHRSIETTSRYTHSTRRGVVTGWKRKHPLSGRRADFAAGARALLQDLSALTSPHRNLDSGAHSEL